MRRERGLPGKRIDLGEGAAGIREPALEGAVIGAGRLVDGAQATHNLGPAQPVHEGAVAGAAIGEAVACAVAHPVGVEIIFRDAMVSLVIFRLSCVCRPQPGCGYPFRPQGKDEGDPTLG